MAINHWFFISGVSFITLIVFVIAFDDRTQAKEKIKSENENNSV